MSSWRISGHQPFGARHWHSYLIVTLVSNLALRKLQIRDEGRLSTTSSKLQHFPFNLSLNAFQRLSLEREEPPGAPSCLVAEKRKGSGDRSIGNTQRGKSEALIEESRKHQTRKFITLNEGNQKTGLSATFWKSLERRATPCIIHIRDLRSDLRVATPKRQQENRSFFKQTSKTFPCSTK